MIVVGPTGPAGHASNDNVTLAVPTPASSGPARGRESCFLSRPPPAHTGVAAAVRDRSGQPIIVCSVGDGTTQGGENSSSVRGAVRSQLPVLFLVEDNEWAISTSTLGQTFLSRPDGPVTEFYGMPNASTAPMHSPPTTPSLES